MEARLLLGSDDAMAGMQGTAALGNLGLEGGGGSGMQGTTRRELGTQTGCAGSSGHGWEGENVKWHVGQPPPLFL